MSNPQLEAQQAYQTYTTLYQHASQLNAAAKVDPSKAEAAQQANQQAHTAYANYQAAWSKAYQEHNKVQETPAAAPVATQPVIAQQPVVQQPMSTPSLFAAQPQVAAPVAQTPAAANPLTAQLSATQLASLFPGAAGAAATPAAAQALPVAANPLAALGALPTPAAPQPAAVQQPAAAAANPMAALANLPGFQQLFAQQIQQATLQAALLQNTAKPAAAEPEKRTNKRTHEESKRGTEKEEYDNSYHQPRRDYHQKPYHKKSYDQNQDYYNQGSYHKPHHHNQSYDNADYGESGYEQKTTDRFGNQITPGAGPAKSRLGARSQGVWNDATQSYDYKDAETGVESRDYTGNSTDTVFVEGLPFDVERQTINDFFSQVGPLRTTGQTQHTGIGRLFVFLDEDKKCNGSASVTFQNAEDAENCCSLLQGKSFPVPKDSHKPPKKRNDSFSSTDDLNRERSAMRSERSYNSSDDEDDRDYKRRKRNSSSSDEGKQTNFVNDPTSTIQSASARMQQPLTAEDKLKSWRVGNGDFGEFLTEKEKPQKSNKSRFQPTFSYDLGSNLITKTTGSWSGNYLSEWRL